MQRRAASHWVGGESVRTQRDHRIDARGAARRQVARDEHHPEKPTAAMAYVTGSSDVTPNCRDSIQLVATIASGNPRTIQVTARRTALPTMCRDCYPAPAPSDAHAEAPGHLRHGIRNHAIH